MSKAALSLRELQEWMSILVQHSKDSAAGARTRAARSIASVSQVNAGDVVIPNSRMKVYERLDIYNHGYFGRLKDVLEGDFPALVHAMGEHDWFHLALGYVARHPSRHPNLNVLNRHLPEYIAKKNLPNRVFLRDLAQLEVFITEAFDAPEFEPFDMESLAQLTPEQWEGAVFGTNPSLRLLESSYAVNRYLQSVFDERLPAPIAEGAPVRSKTFVAIYRKDYRVWRLDLPRPMFLILRALRDGKPLGEAIGAGGDHDEDFQRWFREWSGDGVFSQVTHTSG
jgi:Putative DNA-binding domain